MPIGCSCEAVPDCPDMRLRVQDETRADGAGAFRRTPRGVAGT